MSIIRNFLFVVLNLLRKIIDSSPRLQTLIYNLRNREEFGDLYEHEKMLADSVRVNTYKRGIEKLVNRGDVVLDLGTGTGILSFFAARQKPKIVYAIDHSDFIDVAKKIAKHNNLENIEFIQTNSRNFAPGVKFDVLIHEQMGDYLFNENMIFNILDLRDRLLKPNGKIVPGKFELYLEPAALKKPFSVPFLWENQVHGVDFKFLKNCSEPLNQFKPADYKQKWLGADAVNHFLCDPSPILTFDLNELKTESDIPRCIEISKKIVKPGSFECFCLFFKTIFDEEINFDTSPFSARTHWGNCFFRIEGIECSGSETVEFKLFIPDLLDINKWSVTVENFRRQGRE